LIKKTNFVLDFRKKKYISVLKGTAPYQNILEVNGLNKMLSELCLPFRTVIICKRSSQEVWEIENEFTATR
jgi:hypothetical protein